MGKLIARIIFLVLFVYVITSGFNYAKYAYSLPTDNYVVEWDSTFNITDNEPDSLKCSIAETTCEKTSYRTVRLGISNAYPDYESTVITNIKNTGSMPIKLEAVNIEGEEDLERYINVSFGAADNSSLVDRVIKANEEVEVKLDIRVTENVEQGKGQDGDSGYTFDILITAVQATDENGSGGNNEGGGGDPSDPSGPGDEPGSGDSGGGDEPGDSGTPGDDTIEENIFEELKVEPEQPESMLSIEEEVLPETPQGSITPELTSIPIKYNELPYTGGSPYALVGAVFTMTGIGVLLRKKII